MLACYFVASSNQLVTVNATSTIRQWDLAVFQDSSFGVECVPLAVLSACINSLTLSDEEVERKYGFTRTRVCMCAWCVRSVLSGYLIFCIATF